MIKKIKKLNVFIIAIIFILFFNKYFVQAIENNLKFRKITIKDGLSQSSVECIFQDSKGYMWFGTADGLNRFDGHEFKVYRYNLNDDNSLTSNYINSIIEDKQGFLWIGTTKGLNKIDTYTDKITRYVNDPDNINSLSSYNVWDVMEDSKGYIWVATDKGLNKYDARTNTFTRYFFYKNNSNSLSYDFITSLYEDSDGLIWVGTKDGLNSLDTKKNLFTRYKEDSTNINSISNNYITKIYEDKNKELWIGTKGGLNKYNKKTNKFTHYKSSNSNNQLQSDFIQAISEDSRGILWIGTDRGLSKYNRDTDDFFTYKNQYYDSESLIDNNVLNIYEDRTGMLWIGTYSGISILNPTSKFIHYKKKETEENSLNDNMINGIYVDDQDIIWIATNSGGLNSINRKNGKVKHYMNDPNDDETVSHNRIWSIDEDKDGELWVATSHGLNKFDKTTEKFTRYFNGNDNDKNSLINNEVRYIYVDNSGIIWIGTRHGLDSFDKKKGEFTNYDDLLSDNGIKDQYISSIYEDSDGVLWLGCGVEGGLIKFDRKTNTMKNYKYSKFNNESISNNSIESITEDRYGNLWIATHYGVNKFDKKEEKFTRYTEDEGLCNNYTYGILIDEFNNPWVSTNGGLAKIDVYDNRIINFNVNDGLQSNEFNGYSYFKSKSGEMFFGGINGLNIFNPKDLSKECYSSKVVIESFYINGQPIDIRNGMELKHNEENFSLDFFLPNYENPAKTKYAYILEGVDKKWVYSNYRNYASYTNVKHGKYIFKVKARNSNGIWSEVTEVPITVLRPPWKTWWAYLSYTLIILLIIYVIWNYVTILEGLVNQRTIQLNNKLAENDKLYKKLIENEQFKNKYFINLSHELRSPLNVILSAVQLFKKLCKENKVIEKDTLIKYADVIDRNSNTLLNTINELIDTSKIESGSYRLNITEENIIYLVEDIALSMKQFVESKGIELIIDPEVEEKYIQCDARDIERCIINLISNAVKFTEEGGSIWITIYDKDDFVEISVKDNGSGIAKEYHEIIFNRFGQANNDMSKGKVGSGIGLTLVKSLVELHGGTIKVISEINEGSNFIITLPVKQETIEDKDI